MANSSPEPGTALPPGVADAPYKGEYWDYTTGRSPHIPALASTEQYRQHNEHSSYELELTSFSTILALSGAFGKGGLEGLRPSKPIILPLLYRITASYRS